MAGKGKAVTQELSPAIRTRARRERPASPVSDLLPPLDLKPKPAALPPEMWALHEIETRTHRAEWRPPYRKPVIQRRAPVAVPRWVAVTAVLCALYAAVRHNGLDVDCKLIDDVLQCRMVNRPAPWAQKV